MRSCVAVGRIIPERADVHFGPLTFKIATGDIQCEATVDVQKSLVSVWIRFEQEVENVTDVSNFARQVTGPISDYIAFTIQAAYAVVIDHITDSETGSHFLVPAAEPIFENIDSESYIFQPRNYGEDVQLRPALFTEMSVSRLLSELSQALRRPELTPMYCRLAIETIRSHFQGEGSEANGWRRMRQLLNIDRTALDHFWSLAADQRHGRIRVLTWPERQACLRVAWEVSYRFLLFLEGGSSEERAPPFPLLRDPPGPT